MDSDQQLISLLDRLREDAAQAFALQFTPKSEYPEGFKDLSVLVESVAAALAQHPDFNALDDRFFLGKEVNFYPRMQANNLLRVSVKSGGHAALAWYRRIIAINQTTVRVVGKVFGVHLDAPHRFTNGLTIMPVLALPDSPNSLTLKQGIPMAPGIQFPCAILMEVEDVPVEGPERGHERFLNIVDTMRKVINAFALADQGAPVVAETWAEFADSDLEDAEYGRGWHMNRTDGAVPTHLVHITPNALEWIEKYLALPQDVAKACDVPLARLNIANRRLSPGDQALDGCICLEALLSGRGRGELTHKLSVRTALLLGKTLEEREAIAKKVRDFYGLRSAVVHGTESKNAERERLTASQGLELCRSALRAVIESHSVPEPERWELTGGPTWNRMA